MTRAILAPPRATDLGASEIDAITAGLREVMAEGMIFHKAAARRHGLTFLQLLLLRSIESKGPMAPSAVAAHFGISRPAVTASLNLLEEGGWVARTRTPGDRRARSTILRPPAVKLLRRLDAERRDFIAEALAGMSRMDRLALAHALHRIAEAVRTRHLDPPSEGRP